MKEKKKKKEERERVLGIEGTESRIGEIGKQKRKIKEKEKQRRIGIDFGHL